MITTSICDSVRDLERLAPTWRTLLTRAALGEPVMTPTWLLAWWRQFGGIEDRQLRAVVVTDGPDLVALVPLLRRCVMHRGFIPIRRIELLGTGEDEADEICSDYVGAIVAKGHEDETARIVARLMRGGALGPWDELHLSSMSGDDPFVPALRRALERSGVPTRLEQTGLCPYIPLPASWDAYMKQLDSSRRYLVARALRELDTWVGKRGYELRRATTRAELAEGIAVLRALHAERWAAQGERGVFASARFARFHAEVMEELLTGVDGQLDLLWLVAAGEPIAAVYNIAFDNKVYFYQSGRKLGVPKGVRPGIAIHALAIQRNIREGRREYDFLNGAAQYKLQLSLARRALVTLRATAPTVRARAVQAACATAERAAAEVRRRRSYDAPRVP